MISLNLSGTSPIHEQITNGIIELISNGALLQDDPLPSVRELACDLAVNPNTVQKAYSALEARDITYSVSGKGRFVKLSGGELNKKKIESEKEILLNSAQKLTALGASKAEILEFLKEVIL